jgi:phage nucleotide-binding protein
MSLFKNPNELTINSTIKMLVYGQPGIGKTTLALSAPNPVLFDFDGGVSRINKAHQCPTLQVESWEQVLEALAELEQANDFKTIVVDTAGKMLDYMSDYIMRNDPKMKMRDGSLALKGYGQRKVMFTNLLKRVSMMGKNIVFVAHEKEDKDGETRIVRPDMSGSSLGDLLKELDLVGYMQAYGKDRTICWSPQERFYAKNTCNLPAWEKVPVVIDENGGITGENDFLTKTFAGYAEYLKQQATIGEDYTNVVDQIAADIAAITDADGANAFIAKIDDYGHIWDSKAKARRLFAEHMAKVENVTYDKKTKRYAAKN